MVEFMSTETRPTDDEIIAECYTEESAANANITICKALIAHGKTFESGPGIPEGRGRESAEIVAYGFRSGVSRESLRGLGSFLLKLGEEVERIRRNS